MVEFLRLLGSIYFEFEILNEDYIKSNNPTEHNETKTGNIKRTKKIKRKKK